MLKKGSATMSDDAKSKLERDMDSKTKALQRDTQEVSDDYEQEMGKVFNEIGGKMMQIIEQYSYQNGYAAVLDASNRQQSPVLWAAPSSNITADIIKLYDQAHPAASAPAAGAAKPAAPKRRPRRACSNWPSNQAASSVPRADWRFPSASWSDVSIHPPTLAGLAARCWNACRTRRPPSWIRSSSGCAL